MSHILTSSYGRLAERLNRFPQGAPPSDLLYRILSMLMNEREAELISLLPIKPFTLEKAAGCWGLDERATHKVLDELADRAILVDIEKNGETYYVLPPPMAGFFEFSMMRAREDLDQKLLSELFYQYINKEEDFIRELFTSGDTQLGRVFVNEPSVPEKLSLQVLDYERASEVIRNASCRAVSMCYCRHKMHHLQKACSAPMDICMTFNTTASSLVRHGNARKVDAAECLDLLQKARGHNLVQFGENVRERVNFICNCCKCCCEAMIAARRFANLHPVHTTKFLPQINGQVCSGCGKCRDICPVEAISMTPAGGPQEKVRMTASLQEDICLGCGICVQACNRGAVKLKPRPGRIITPLNSAHRTVVMAIERGKLQDLIFDNHVLLSHRALAAVLGIILRLTPVKRFLAAEQVKSRYLEALIRRVLK